MSTQSNTLPESALNSPTVAPAATSATRPIYWSIRREFWENRYLYAAPLCVAAVFLVGFLISMIHSPGQVSTFAALGSTHDSFTHHGEVLGPFEVAAALMMGTFILMCLFYCAEALHSERRDRSILFWKSLPVSDVITVLVKASIPLLILPVLVSVITGVTLLVMLLLSSAVLLATGGNVAALWTHLPIVRMSLLTLYHLLTAHALWAAPIYCWLILVSGWARRAALLWAALPAAVIAGLEKMAFNTSHFGDLVISRLSGSGASIASTDVFPSNPMTHITPGAFLASPGLWMGLAVAATFLAAAVQLRRRQGPV
jgi:ABC-2 type transport system permease protein